MSATGPAEPPAPEEKSIEALLREVLDDPEKALDENISDAQIEEMTRKLRPYASRVGEPPAPGRRTVLACSFTNLRETYMRRFLMTSLVGFLFQFLHEWEVPEEQRRWTPAKQKQPVAVRSAKSLVESLKEALSIAELAAKAEAEATEAGTASASGSSPAPAGAASEGERQPDSSAAPASPAAGPGSGQESKRAASPAAAPALAYAAAHVTHRLGAEISKQLLPMWRAANKHPEARDVLAKYPAPAPGGQQTVPAAAAKVAIEGFLKHLLQFDPSVHVRSAHDAKGRETSLDETLRRDLKDPERPTVESLRSPPPPRPEHKEALASIRAARCEAAALAVLRDPELAAAFAVAQGAAEAFRDYLAPPPQGDPARPALERVPPQDTFHRWQFYTDCNYERLRAITSALYEEKPDLDVAIAPWEVITGPAGEVDNQYKAFCRKWEDQTPSAIYSIEVGRGWTLMGEFAKNRERVDFYTRNTEVLERILRRHEDDQKVGKQLMQKRIQVKKAENIRNDGPDAKGLAAYRQNQEELSARGAQRLPPEVVEDLEAAGGDLERARELQLLREYRNTIAQLEGVQKTRPLTFDEEKNLKIAKSQLPRAEEMARVPADAVQVDVFETNARTGQFTRSRFYTEAEAPAEVAVSDEKRAAATARSLHPAAALGPRPEPPRDGHPGATTDHSLHPAAALRQRPAPSQDGHPSAPPRG